MWWSPNYKTPPGLRGSPLTGPAATQGMPRGLFYCFIRAARCQRVGQPAPWQPKAPDDFYQTPSPQLRGVRRSPRRNVGSRKSIYKEQPPRIKKRKDRHGLTDWVHAGGIDFFSASPLGVSSQDRLQAGLWRYCIHQNNSHEKNYSVPIATGYPDKNHGRRRHVASHAAWPAGLQ